MTPGHVAPAPRRTRPVSFPFFCFFCLITCRQPFVVLSTSFGNAFDVGDDNEFPPADLDQLAEVAALACVVAAVLRESEELPSRGRDGHEGRALRRLVRFFPLFCLPPQPLASHAGSVVAM